MLPFFFSFRPFLSYISHWLYVSQRKSEVLPFSYDTAVLIGIQAGGSSTDQWVGAAAQSHDHGIHIQLKLAALLDDGVYGQSKLHTFR